MIILNMLLVGGALAAVLTAILWLLPIRPQTRGPAQPTASDEYFSPDYFTARSLFRQKVVRAGGQLSALELEARGPAGDALTIDIGWFGAKNPRRILLHSSGVHGVEGFTGSAIQLQLLDKTPVVAEDAAIVLIHGLNPYGMSWLRRFNENNVDLNRNFMASDADYVGAPPKYHDLNSFLNPPSPPRSSFSYYPRTAWLILRFGLVALRQAVAGGQYEYPRGVFFGGQSLQQGPQLIQTWLSNHVGSADRVVAVDVHTGLGAYGEDTLLVQKHNYDRLRTLFGERVAPLDPDQGPAYQVRGDYLHMLGRMFPNASPLLVTQEFGTYHSVRVLQALREENRAHHYGPADVTSAQKLALKEAFNPDDARWRQLVLKRGQEVINQALTLAFDQRGSVGVP